MSDDRDFIDAPETPLPSEYHTLPILRAKDILIDGKPLIPPPNPLAEQYLDFLVHLYRTGSDQERYGMMIRLKDYGYELAEDVDEFPTPDEFGSHLVALARVCLGE